MKNMRQRSSLTKSLTDLNSGDAVIVRGGDVDPAIGGRIALIDRADETFIWVEGRRYDRRTGWEYGGSNGFDAEPFWVEPEP
jgi:hypothetical protein